MWNIMENLTAFVGYKHFPNPTDNFTSHEALPVFNESSKGIKKDLQIVGSVKIL